MSVLDSRPLELDGLVELTPHRFADERGFFSEVWREDAFAAAGVHAHFVQDNLSLSKRKGVIRGLHYQSPPAAQAKLVRVSRGAIFDVAVDIRPGSATYGRWAGVILSAEKWNQLFIPEGFAHGFATLEDDTEVSYKVTAPYSPDHDRAIRFDDPDIGIDWPLDAEPLLSPKDAAAPLLRDSNTGF
ncbi:dTDP-4-dehydrorhamnose 3,5-epimerase [Sphingomonas hankyongi]|uniref:dTDP-4-dehydrorhamnose 3,5-epimerase n=1 Tax=Sphingomonas hankyongi TaxID=2908209 RepID=A0ABT0S3D5_9SPHN|nr:dTDP-4-dehydrorhamnose 3,5-epimerase [Sphingomonas hankyongi]MCL6730144.1 dTDP-4-dehydrorhamnose 3,5-epimerase [Sphingomonas hankyongi]